MSEEWRPVAGLDGMYEVSSLGRVRSVDRLVKHTLGGPKNIRGKILVLSTSGNSGYPKVTLSVNGVNVYRNVHSMVAEAFLGKKPSEASVVNHKDGNKKNCRTDNLEWCSRSDNNRHSFAVLGNLPPQGERHWRVRLTADQVRSIRAAKPYATYAALAQQYGVAPTTIQCIVERRTWKHVA